VPDADDRAKRHRLRATFESEAERYDRARHGYPEAVFDDLERLAGLGPGSRVLEIGCGTGQATRSLARRGYAVLGLELGPGLAAIARRKLAGFPNVEVVVADFDEWQLPANGLEAGGVGGTGRAGAEAGGGTGGFDAVVVATAFHWLDPSTRLARIGELLRPGGALAVLRTDHVAGGTEGFWSEIEDCYRRFDPDPGPGSGPPDADEFSPPVAELEGEPFSAVTVSRHLADSRYTSAEFVDLMATFSPVIDLEPERRSGLLGCVGRLIDERYDGGIVRRELTTLRLARRDGAPAGADPLG
jgi:SAM-dependent methyltransferase